ncbi:phycobilisome degradation protein nblA [Microcoleus sp. B3-D7]
MDKELIKITTEQDFRLKVFSDEVKELSAVESHILLTEMMRQNMIKDNVIKGLLGVKPSER